MINSNNKAVQIRSEHAELYHLLKYHSLAILNGKARQPVAIAFTSYYSGEGVSTQVTNFALSLSQEPNVRILLVDFNVKNPSLHRYFASEDLTNGNGDENGNPNGSADVQSPASELVVRDKEMVHPNPQLDVIISRRRADRYPDPANCLENIELFISKAKEQYDYILIDAPPLYYNSFAHLLAARSDYLMLVVKAHGVRRYALREEIAQLGRLGANILGVILNKREYPIPGWIYRIFCGGSK
jgi:Mrp family chromosome partitioning ATPase